MVLTNQTTFLNLLFIYVCLFSYPFVLLSFFMYHPQMVQVAKTALKATTSQPIYNLYLLVGPKKGEISVKKY